MIRLVMDSGALICSVVIFTSDFDNKNLQWGLDCFIDRGKVFSCLIQVFGCYQLRSVYWMYRCEFHDIDHGRIPHLKGAEEASQSNCSTLIRSPYLLIATTLTAQLLVGVP